MTSRSVGLRLRGGTDRRVTLLAMSLAAAFVGLTILSVLTPAAATLGTWLPLHLLLAGAASTAIAGVMPFFSAAVSNAPPAATAVRLLGVLGVATGAVLLVIGRGYWPVGSGISGTQVAGFGGLAYLVGLTAVGAATLLPLRVAIGARRMFMGAIYGLALLNVAAGVALSTAFLFGWPPVMSAWVQLKPAHAWLNLFGFVSLVIAGSLLHLLPTVVGARIRRTRASIVCFAALAFGPPLVALGFAAQIAVLQLIGSAVTVIGALALAWHAVAVMRSRATWTSDHWWHLFTTWSLIAGIGWFVVAALFGAGEIVTGSSAPAAWNLAPLAAPLGIGWVAQVLIGAWSHLVPAVGPGSPEQHARQRAILGRAGSFRLAMVNLGAGAIVAGGAFSIQSLELAGLAAVLIAGVIAVVLLATALAVLPRRA